MKIAVIPKPLHIEPGSGIFTIFNGTTIQTDTTNSALMLSAVYLRDKFAATGTRLEIKPPHPALTGNFIRIELIPTPDTLGAEGYRLTVTPDSVLLQADHPAGAFRGIQTIRQLLPPEIEDTIPKPNVQWKLPVVSITDKPRFRWRGMLLDCGRHFMSVDFVKRYIDLLAYYKMNTFHWHLTEDQGWRIEIKKYPRLTSVGAWRKEADGSIYGGFYTQDEVKDIVRYARDRFIQVIPEIEMPGHSMAALAAYPQYSCTGGPFEVQNTWGVHDDIYCAGNDKTFDFLENVLTEVMDLFPSKYIHIGGDEAPKVRWEKCPKCQKRIKKEGLKDEHELQSYFIKRIEKFLNTHDRKIIGWDEILEGGLAPDATVQSWRGMEGGIAAAQSGHDVIMSPTSHAYFDYDIKDVDLRKVYSFEPVPDVLTPAEAKHVIGGECNLWSEHTPQDTVDFFVFPRLLAMAEVLWSSPQDRDYDEFHKRVEVNYKCLDILGVKYSAEGKAASIYSSFDRESGTFNAELEAGNRNLVLRYTTNGDEPTSQSFIYEQPLHFSKAVVLKAAAFSDGKKYGKTQVRTFAPHKGMGLLPVLALPYSNKYTAGGPYGLTDGLRGSNLFKDGLWQGFEGDDLNAVIDLGSLQQIQTIKAGFLMNTSSWIFLPENVSVFVSDDGQNFTPVDSVKNNIPQKDPKVHIKDFSLNVQRTARYVKLFAKNIGVCPDWHPGAGEKAWIFCDEIIIN